MPKVEKTRTKLPHVLGISQVENTPNEYLCWCKQPLEIRDEKLLCHKGICLVNFPVADLKAFYHCQLCKCIRKRDECNCFKFDATIASLRATKNPQCFCEKPAWIQKTKKHAVKDNYYFAICGQNNRLADETWSKTCTFWKKMT